MADDRRGSEFPDKFLNEDTENPANSAECVRNENKRNMPYTASKTTDIETLRAPCPPGTCSATSAR